MLFIIIKKGNKVSKLIKFIINNRERLLKCSDEGATAPETIRQKDRKILTLERD